METEETTELWGHSALFLAAGAFALLSAFFFSSIVTPCKLKISNNRLPLAYHSLL